MDLPGIGLQLGPQGLLADHLPQLVVARVRRRQPCHLRDETQEAFLGLRIAIGILPHLDQAGDLLLHHDRRQVDHEVGRVARGCFALFRRADAAVRRHHLRPAHLGGHAQQFVVRLAVGVALVEADQVHLDLVLQLQVSLRRAHPHGARRRRHRVQDALEKLAVIITRRHVAFRVAGNLRDQRIDALPGFFQQIQINLWFGAGTHR